MPELLLELFCEEIPARMQARAAADLERLLMDRLTAAGLLPEASTAFAGPRRLTAVVTGLAEKSPDVRQERKGPRVDAPVKAIEGFLRGAGLDSVDQCETRQDKKGEHYVAVIAKQGRDTRAIIAEAVPDLMRAFPWPKSMRSGEGSFRWVRPLRRIVCLFDGEVCPFEVDGVASGDQTEGHRLHGRGPFKVKDFDSYARALKEEGKIVLDASERRDVILADARTLCAAQNLELVEDEGLLDEVAGLAEHPVVLVGDMDAAFLDLPPEVIRLTMRTHQKYFAVRDPKKDGLAAKFVVVANQTAPDGGKAIAAGNARVLSARLNDARYFWDNDRKTPLDDMAKGLGGIVFHQKLGSIADKVERVAALARELAPVVGAEPDLAERAARLVKADLVSEMVYEFPELQGVMGRYYALIQAGLAPLSPPSLVTPPSAAPRDEGDSGRRGKASESKADGNAAPHPEEPRSGVTRDEERAVRAVADAIRDHYRPQGPSDAVPTAPVSVAVALADKLDTLVGFWAIDEKPTGSKDPYALRRAALGVIRILLAGDIRLSLFKASQGHVEARQFEEISRRGVHMSGVLLHHLMRPTHDVACIGGIDLDQMAARAPELCADLLAFLADRLKVHLRDEGHRYDLVDAVFALGEDDLVLIVKRVEALGRFLDAAHGAELLAAYKRATNILTAEEKKHGESYDAEPLEALLQEPEERRLFASLAEARAKVDAAVKAEAFEDAMAALAPLREPIDAFFEQVTVNAEDDQLRRNRLALLSRFRAALSEVADFSRIAG